MLTSIAMLGIAYHVGAPTWITVIAWAAVAVNLIAFGIKIKEAADQ